MQCYIYKRPCLGRYPKTDLGEGDKMKPPGVRYCFTLKSSSPQREIKYEIRHVLDKEKFIVVVDPVTLGNRDLTVHHLIEQAVAFSEVTLGPRGLYKYNIISREEVGVEIDRPTNRGIQPSLHRLRSDQVFKNKKCLDFFITLFSLKYQVISHKNSF